MQTVSSAEKNKKRRRNKLEDLGDDILLKNTQLSLLISIFRINKYGYLCLN